MQDLFTRLSTKNPKSVIALIVALALILASAAALPTIFPDSFKGMNQLKIDTDPENMLSAKEPVRVIHNQLKKQFDLHDILVVGVENNSHTQGVFNRDSLTKIYNLVQYAKTLQWTENGKKAGVLSVDIIAPNTVDNIKPGSEGEVVFEWLMSKPPHSDEEAQQILKRAQRIPFLNDTLVSHDGKAIALYIPLSSKDVSYRVSTRLQEKISTFLGQEEWHITGLPVANDTFGVEMFKQMAISAPIAMLAIFLLMLFFFRKLILIISPLVLAGLTVACTMGLLVITGNTVHIMSSMIPIFIMPIAVLDSVHILSEFFDRYPLLKSREKTISVVMKELFSPMLYTSLTSAAGFFSLALTPIPPVQVFGIFVGTGVMLAWLFTVTFIPAYIMMIPESKLENFGNTQSHSDNETKFAGFLRTWSTKRPWYVISGSLVVIILAIIGITKIQVNDNPVLWFESSHPIRVADRALNRHFGGTYMAYLTFTAEESPTVDSLKGIIHRKLNDLKERYSSLSKTESIVQGVENQLNQINAMDVKTFVKGVNKYTGAEFLDEMDAAENSYYPLYEDMETALYSLSGAGEVIKQPSVLKWLGDLQEHLLKTGIVGKSNSIADVVKTVHRELRSGDEKYFAIPDTKAAVAQCLITYQSSHRPQDLWHFVTPDYTSTSLWLQLTSGNNKEMVSVEKSVEEYLKANPAPVALKHQWFGLTYINVVWQDKMVVGMLQAFLGSFLVVFIMMTYLFRSVLWGFLSMIPLSLTIAFIYGAVGLIGKDYDMPIAVLSSLTLGLAVDFAIHFLARARALHEKHGTWEKVIPHIFGEPTTAITRNLVVVAVGFTPLLFAPLIPYKTVGVFLATILSVAGFATLLLLPAVLTLMEKKFFKSASEHPSCKCSTCSIIALSFILLVAVNLQGLFQIPVSHYYTWGMAAALAGLIGCTILSKRQSCKS
jgi:predicted RND superfamily exporter protein